MCPVGRLDKSYDEYAVVWLSIESGVPVFDKGCKNVVSREASTQTVHNGHPVNSKFTVAVVELVRWALVICPAKGIAVSWSVTKFTVLDQEVSLAITMNALA